MRISAVWYPVSKWQEAKHFYGELLGLKQTYCNNEAGWVAYSTSRGPPLFLVRKPERAGGQGGAVVTFESSNLEALRERLILAGAKVNKNIQEGAGARILTFYDPDGNTLEASQPIGG